LADSLAEQFLAPYVHDRVPGAGVARKKIRDVADAYLRFLYTPEAQEIEVKHHFRPRLPEVAARHADLFPQIDLMTIDDPIFGGWTAAQKKHFASDGIFDRIFTSGR
jgi:sulfate transport system substrate-binding protein